MEPKTLTTEDYDSQVNEEKVQPVVEDTKEQEDQVVDNTTTELESDLYDEAWDKIDVNNVEQFEEISNAENSKPPENFFDDTTEDVPEVNNDIQTNVFMSEKPVLKFKGRDVPIDTKDELIALAQKGFKLETEMANIKPQKKILNIVEDIPVETLQAVSDLHSGNKDAIEYLKKQYNIVDTKQHDDYWDTDNTDDTNNNTSYTPEVEEEDPVAVLWKDYSNEKPQSAGKVVEIYDTLDDSFKNEIYKPDVFQLFISSVESGEFENVYPIAAKEKALNPAINWLQAYSFALKKGNSQKEIPEPPVSAVPPKNINDGRDMLSGNADRVWADDDYFHSLESKLFR